MKSHSTILLLAAAGRGVRLGGNESKAWISLCGKPLLRYALQTSFQIKELDAVILIVPPDEMSRAEAAMQDWGSASIETKIIAGGARRQDSIGRGLEALPPECEIVVVHDAARIFASPALFSKVVSAASRAGAATAAIEPADTIAQLGPDSEPVYLDRRSLRLIQTPQAFRADVLKEAHKKAAQDRIEATDDASLVKWLGRKVEIVEGEVSNFKITYPEDLRRAEFIIGNKTGKN